MQEETNEKTIKKGGAATAKATAGASQTAAKKAAAFVGRHPAGVIIAIAALLLFIMVYGLHHQSDDGKYLIMGNGTRAFAVPVQPENYLKAAEQTTEQNYNMIDGQINNTPTTAELEAKVKAGETISLVDLAEAVKADKERGKAAKTEKKPSIRAQLRADKEKTAQKKAAKSKNHELEV